MGPQIFHKLALNGRVLDVLAAMERPRLRAELLEMPSVGSEGWFDRRIRRQLVHADLVSVERRGRKTLYTARDPPLARAASDLLSARPDVRLGWRTSLELSVLLTLPTWEGPPSPWSVAGCSESSWWHTIGGLQDAGFVLADRSWPRRYHVNPRILELVRFLDVLRRQLELVPQDLLEHRGAEAGPPSRCIHLRGSEAAWRVPHGALGDGYSRVDPAAVGGLDQLVHPHQLAYAGNRVLDRWDHILLFARAYLGRTQDGGVAIEPRVLNAIAASIGPTGTGAELVQRAGFYGIPDLPRQVEAAWTEHPEEIDRFLRAQRGER